jgi:hypothetical protein
MNLQKISENSFIDELQKIAGKKSEIAGTGAIAGSSGIGYLLNKRKIKQINNAGLTTDEFMGALNDMIGKNKIGKIYAKFQGLTLKHPGKLALGTLGTGLVAPLALGLLHKSLSKEEMSKQNKKTISNLTFGPYRFGKRIKTSFFHKGE